MVYLWYFWGCYQQFFQHFSIKFEHAQGIDCGLNQLECQHK
jgi:hypothetical protein